MSFMMKIVLAIGGALLVGVSILVAVAAFFPSEEYNGDGKTSMPFFGSDMSGKKMFEEFYTDVDVKDEATFINLGAVKNSKKRPVSEVESIFENLRKVFARHNSTKADVIDVLKEYLPNFQHIEKGKSLDSRM